MLLDTKQNYHIAETMQLLSKCHQESSGSSSSAMLMSSCHKTVSKRSSSCSQVGLLLSSQSTSVTLTWVTAKAGYGQWLELGSIKNHFTVYWELPNTWGMIISGSWATLDFTWDMSFCYLSVLSQKIFEPLVPWAFSFLSSSATSRCDLGCGSFSAASAWTSKL